MRLIAVGCSRAPHPTVRFSALLECRDIERNTYELAGPAQVHMPNVRSMRFPVQTCHSASGHLRTSELIRRGALSTVSGSTWADGSRAENGGQVDGRGGAESKDGGMRCAFPPYAMTRNIPRLAEVFWFFFSKKERLLTRPR